MPPGGPACFCGTMLGLPGICFAQVPGDEPRHRCHSRHRPWEADDHADILAPCRNPKPHRRCAGKVSATARRGQCQCCGQSDGEGNCDSGAWYVSSTAVRPIMPGEAPRFNRTVGRALEFCRMGRGKDAFFTRVAENPSTSRAPGGRWFSEKRVKKERVFSSTHPTRCCSSLLSNQSSEKTEALYLLELSAAVRLRQWRPWSWAATRLARLPAHTHRRA